MIDRSVPHWIHSCAVTAFVAANLLWCGAAGAQEAPAPPLLQGRTVEVALSAEEESRSVRYRVIGGGEAVIDGRNFGLDLSKVKAGDLGFLLRVDVDQPEGALSLSGSRDGD